MIYVKPTQNTLHWVLRYIRWMHVNPFGHDQNGWDALLGHSIQNEPLAPSRRFRGDARHLWLRPPNVSFQVLDTSEEFLTLTGWAGAELSKVQLLHLSLVFARFRCLSGRIKDADHAHRCPREAAHLLPPHGRLRA